jgi:hypothetical protein
MFQAVSGKYKIFPEIDQPVCGKYETGHVLSYIAEIEELSIFEIQFRDLIIQLF